MCNPRGGTSRFERFIALIWPGAGELSTPERAAWNNTPAGTCPAWPSPAQPADTARAFALLTEEAGTRRGEDWSLAIAEHGEWYRIETPLGSARRRGGRKTDAYISIEHATHLNQLTCRAGLRCRRSGARIPCRPRPAGVVNGRLAGPRPRQRRAAGADPRRRRRDHGDARRLDEAPPVDRGSHGLGRQSTSGPGWWQPSQRAWEALDRQGLDVAAATWQLAEAAESVTDLDERTFLAEHAPGAADHLAAAAAPETVRLPADGPVIVH